MTAKHRGGRRPWRRRVPGVLVAVLAAASAVAVAGLALRGTATQSVATGGAGLALTASGGGLRRARRHRGEHRGAAAVTSESADGALAQEPPTAVPDLRLPDAPPAVAVSGQRSPLSLVPALPASSATSAASSLDPMSDTVPHPVVKLFPLGPLSAQRDERAGRAARDADLEPDFAAGSIDERVYAAFDAERQQAQTSALADGRHADVQPGRAAVVARNGNYRSRHSA